MRLAVIGCGTIAQVMHIPYAVEIPEIEVAALVDPSPDRREGLANQYNIPGRYESTEELIEDSKLDIDAAIVLTPPHTHVDAVVPLLEAGIDILVEKPLAISPSDADRMVDAAQASAATAMVAYMKRYDPAYKQLNKELDELETIDLITAYDVDPDHGRILNEVYDLIDGDVPESLIEESTRKRHADALEAIGGEVESNVNNAGGQTVDPNELADDYDWHLEHICHDINALRGLFGDVSRIDHVDLHADRRYATANLVYGSDDRCQLTSGLSNRKWFEERIRVDAPDRSMELEFSNPFIKNTPTKLTVKQGIEELSERTHVPSYDESFKREIEHFVTAATDTATVETTFEEARDDVYLIADLFRAYRGVDLIGEYESVSEPSLPLIDS